MLKYGFELEGFARVGNEVVIPPAHWPTDGFPGLVEMRTVGGTDLSSALSGLVREILRLDTTKVQADFLLHEHKFTGAQLAELRRTREYGKDFLDVRNLYGKEPRNTNGKTLASFQINISNCLRDSCIITEYDKGGNPRQVTKPAIYGPLDVAHLVKALDEEFKEEIKETKRQPGMYSIKEDCRLEYRSLPNKVFRHDLESLKVLQARITKAVNNA